MANPWMLKRWFDPDNDGIAARVKSPLLKTHQLEISIKFPYGTGDVKTADWEHPEAHETILVQPKPNQAEFTRKLDNDIYSAIGKMDKGATLTNMVKHQFEIVPGKNSD